MIVPASVQAIERAVQLLKEGQCIGIPTETVYGLAADGLNEKAVLNIFRIKNRPTFDPLIIHVASQYPLSSICEVNPLAHKLIKAFWTGPLTLLLPKKEIVPDIVTSGLPHVAVRCPQHRVAQDLLKAFGGPLAAPSANRFGRISPTDAMAVDEELGDAVPMILDGGSCALGIESTIIYCNEISPTILRKGAISAEEIAKVINQPICYEVTKSLSPQAPGLLDSHYAPSVKLYRSLKPLADYSYLPESYAYVFWSRLPQHLPHHYRLLAPEEDMHHAAMHLFRYMRELDRLNPKAIIADPIPLRDLGIAIDDRLQRACCGEISFEGGVEQMKLKTLSS